MSQSINIIKLIEENPNTKLSKPYQGKLINKLKDSFSTDEQQLFISSFYCYLNYKSDDFVIDLDDIWSWLGFTRKDNTKRLLEKYFKPDIDFKRVFLRSEENSSIGRPSEKIMPQFPEPIVILVMQILEISTVLIGQLNQGESKIHHNDP